MAKRKRPPKQITRAEVLAFLRAHPELAPKNPTEKALTAAKDIYVKTGSQRRKAITEAGRARFRYRQGKASKLLTPKRLSGE